MSNDYTNPAFKKLLKKLQEESWQLELIISGFAIFGLITAYPNIQSSVQESENSEQIQAFLNSEAGKRFTLKREETLLVHQTGFDGFFIAELNAE